MVLCENIIGFQCRRSSIDLFIYLCMFVLDTFVVCLEYSIIDDLLHS